MRALALLLFPAGSTTRPAAGSVSRLKLQRNSRKVVMTRLDILLDGVEGR